MKAFYSIILFCFYCLPLFAQGERVMGVFNTGKDFSEGKLSYMIDCTSKKSKILLNDFLFKKNITVKQNDSSFRLFKDSIWGYENCNKQVYRFLHKKELLLLNKDEEILIYKHILPKATSGRTNVTRYYFSIGKEAEVQSLTIKNLKNAFDDNEKFKIAIDKNFEYSTELAAYDETSKMYKINWLLKKIQ